MAPHLVQNHGVHLAVRILCRPHDHIGDAGVHDHLRAEETRPDPGQLVSLHLKPREVQRAAPRLLARLDERVHLGVDAPAPLVVGP